MKSKAGENYIGKMLTVCALHQLWLWWSSMDEMSGIHSINVENAKHIQPVLFSRKVSWQYSKNKTDTIKPTFSLLNQRKMFIVPVNTHCHEGKHWLLFRKHKEKTPPFRQWNRYKDSTEIQRNRTWCVCVNWIQPSQPKLLWIW